MKIFKVLEEETDVEFGMFWLQEMNTTAKTKWIYNEEN